ncbi:MAG: DMT family transporter [Pseudomonadota bacterium]
MLSQSHSATIDRDAYSRGVLYVLAAGIVWSTVGLGVRLIDEATSWHILLYRSLTLTPFLFAVLWVRSGGRPIAVIRSAGISALIAGFALFLAFAGGIYAIQKTTVASALLLFASAPVFAALLGRLFLGERVRAATAVAIFVALIGVAVMVADGFSTGNMIGNLAAIGSAIGFAVYSVVLRWGKARDMMPSVFLSGLITIVLAAVICIGNGLPLTVSTNDATVALLMGVCQIGVGLVLFTIGSRAVPSAELTLLSLGEVMLAPVWVWLYIGEVPSQFTVVGGSILLAAIIGNAMTGMSRKPAPVETMDR